VQPTKPSIGEFISLAKLGRSSAAPLHLPHLAYLPRVTSL
jgi:hypothetical protein